MHPRNNSQKFTTINDTEKTTETFHSNDREFYVCCKTVASYVLCKKGANSRRLTLRKVVVYRKLFFPTEVYLCERNNAIFKRSYRVSVLLPNRLLSESLPLEVMVAWLSLVPHSHVG